MIPSALSEHLSAGMADFLRASFRSTTPGMGDVIDELIARPGALSRGPYLSAALPFTAGRNPAWFPHIPLPFTPHAHQEAAFERLSGRRPRNTLVATGTGSGKTECFLLPILDHCRQTAEQKGVKAILVYPMNALATDQAKRIARMIDQTPSLKGRVRAGLYVGESTGGKRRQGHALMGPRHVITDRAAMQTDPPDILLTNYKMLDYLLLRPEDQGLWKHNSGPGVLQYLVVDELHTFDGAQGTDLACLVRRLKRHLEEDRGGLCCVGTSATLGGEASAEALVAYASDVFGELFDARAVITEQRVSVDEFIGDAPAQFTDGPEPAQLEALQPRVDESPMTWLQRQAGLWFDDDAPDLSTAAGRVALGERLKGHAMFRAMLRALDGRPMAVEALVDTLGRRRRDFRRDAAFGRAVVVSLVGLISAARAWRGGDGGALGRFLDVRVQLWYRALSRMVATVEAEPRLVFSDDLDREQSGRHLPMVHCRECQALGWATVVDRDKPHRYSCGLQTFYRKFFGRDAQVRFLWPAASRPNDPAWRHQAVKWVSSRSLTVTDERGDDGVEVVESPNLRTVDGKLRSHNDCPFCGAQRVLTLVGYQPATLLSVFVDQLFGLRFNPDKKLLAFSDNVQDAAHRAGFFEARTWRTNLRVAMAQALVEAGRVRLDALPGRVAEWGHGRMSPPEWLATFLPPDMDWMAEWDAFRAGSETHGEELARLVERRLRWETVREFGHRSRLGRALMRSGAAAAVIDPMLLEAAVDAALEPLRNEVPGLRAVERKTVRWLVLGLADRLRQRGAIVHPELPNRYLGSGGGDTFVFKQWVHLPSGQQQLPVFLTDRPGTAHFETWTAPPGRPPTWYGRWVARVLGDVGGLGPDADSVYRVLLPAMVRSGLLVERVGEDDRRIRVWGLPESAIWVEAGSRALLCRVCGYRGRCGPADGMSRDGMDGMPDIDGDICRDMPCVTATCPGRYVIDGTSGATFHGAQYAHGDVARIFAEEHTGLLKRDAREAVEDEFKAEPDDEPPRQPWYPNLLSCTPTLEMGIDIGDLSSTVLCQVPPAQANYLQRVGRAGRRDGNAFVLTMATSRPHDLYFFAEPTEMLAGEVSPPGIYLDAAAVLERQLAAYCVDRWVAEGGDSVVLPGRLREVLSGLGSDDPGRFPKSLLGFIEGHRPRLLREFCEMFDGRLSAASQEHLQQYLEGDDKTVGAFAWRLSDLLHAERKQRDSLSAQIKTLTTEIRKLKNSPAPPKDLEERVGELEDEKQALQSLVKELDERRTLEFLTNEGILPNYAFPESPVRLRSVIWRKKLAARDGDRGFERRAYEYTRPPATALTELAPEATFYAGGRKVTIDQVDLPVAEVEEWRFCPACNHARPLHLEGDPENCTHCGATWSDPDQKLRLLRMRQVFARAPERTSRIRDQHDEREPRFFQREMLVDHQPEDRGGAWRIDDPRMPFGLEFLKRATFRELNFGEPETGGAQLTIAGRAEQRPGFVVCAQCGKVQPSERVRRREHARGREAEPQHAPWCSSKVKGTEPVYESCLYLYRTFDSEALRILMPLVDVGNQQGLHSFVAALQTGLRARFGGRVDHIRTTLYSEPDETSGLRKQYLVLYDSVPGGTGYLKQLVTEREDGTPALKQVLEYALDRIENCICWHDPDRDGCYRCLYHHRNARDMNDTSARVAEGLIRRLLDVWHLIEPIESLGKVSLSGLMDSVLEARFIEALRHVKVEGQSGSVEHHLIGNAKPGYRVSLGGQTWSIEPQVDAGPADGVEVPSKIDFVLRQSGAYGDASRSIAVFTDGWQYHRDRVGLDLQQRQALIAAGWEVWSFTWADVDAVLAPKTRYDRRQLIHPDLSTLAMRLKTRGVTEWAESAEAPIFQVFADRLARAPDAPPDWAKIGLEMAAARVGRATAASTGAWHALVDSAVPTPIKGVLPASIPLSSDPGWPSGEHVRTQTVHDGKGVALILALDDSEGWHEHPDARAEWNGLLHALNLLQGLAHGPTGLWAFARGKAQRDGWQRLLEVRSPSEGWAASDLYEDEYRPLLEALEAAGVEAPDVGIELNDDRDQVWGEAELVWADAKVAVVYADVKDEGRGMPAGWVIFVLETVQSDPTPLIERLGKGDE